MAMQRKLFTDYAKRMLELGRMELSETVVAFPGQTPTAKGIEAVPSVWGAMNTQPQLDQPTPAMDRPDMS